MNRTVASAALALTITAAALAAATPAHAGADNVTICHATGAGKYVQLTVDKAGVVNGHAGPTHQAGADIIPAFNWIEDRTRHYFDGQNTDKLDLLAKGCKADAVPGTVTPAAPTYAPATCQNPDAPWGAVTIPEQLGDGIAATTPPVLNEQAGTWTVTYTLNADTEDTIYTWPKDQTGVYTFPAVHISADPLWVVDSKTGAGQCELSDTGADGISNTALMIGGGAIGLGLMFTAASKIRRRTA